jgi:ketosteroid isomerase-like protein
MSADSIRTAFDALGGRDVEPLAALMHPDIEWRSRRTWRFWKRASLLTRGGRGPCGPQSTIEWRDREGDHDLRVEHVEQRDRRVAVVVSWAERSGKRHAWAHVLRLQDGMIIDMQDYASRPRAIRALRRPTLTLSSRAR